MTPIFLGMTKFVEMKDHFKQDPVRLSCILRSSRLLVGRPSQASGLTDQVILSMHNPHTTGSNILRKWVVYIIQYEAKEGR